MRELVQPRGDALKSTFGVAVKATSRRQFLWGMGFSLPNTAAMKLYYKPYLVL